MKTQLNEHVMWIGPLRVMVTDLEDAARQLVLIRDAWHRAGEEVFSYGQDCLVIGQVTIDRRTFVVADDGGVWDGDEEVRPARDLEDFYDLHENALLLRIAMWQSVQRANPPTSSLSERAARELSPLLDVLATRARVEEEERAGLEASALACAG
jgi:hypothetical protein